MKVEEYRYLDAILLPTRYEMSKSEEMHPVSPLIASAGQSQLGEKSYSSAARMLTCAIDGHEDESCIHISEIPKGSVAL